MKYNFENFVLNYRRWTHAPRSYDEAFKTADYATPIWRCETENEAWWRTNGWWIVSIILALGFIFVLYPTLEWIITQ